LGNQFKEEHNMTDALIVVDPQVDFCPGGALPVPQGDLVIPVLNRYLKLAGEQGMPIFVSRDWHPARTTHFAAYGGPWPVHCVQGTPGAQFQPELHLPTTAQIASKGMGETDAGYSALEGLLPDGRPLPDALRELGITQVHVGGLATDYCVRATVLGALAAGLQARLLVDASRPVDVQPGDGERAVQAMLAAGAQTETLTEFAR
jgi:nicotinamidase/pyrazinamidase